MVRIYRAALAIAATILFLPITSAQDLVRERLTDDFGESRAFSRAVATEGGRIVWLAGQTVVADADGNSLAGDFEGQTYEIFRLLGERLAYFGGDLSDIVEMTVYISDTRFGDPFVEIRKEMFGPGGYPASALVTVVGFARPESLIEIKATAVVGDEQ